jgi:hypothetical protein
MIMNCEQERIWRVAAMAQLKILSWHLPEEAAENYKNPQQGQLITS